MSRCRRSRFIVLATLFFATTLSTAARGDVFEWEWIDPGDPLLGKYETTIVCPDGAGLTPAPGMDAANADLTKAYLIDYDLREAIFYSANLSNADFNSARLLNADFTNSGIRAADLSSTTAGGFTMAQLESTGSYAAGNLSEINFGGNSMFYWDFESKNLTGAVMTAADLSAANLHRATLAGVDFEDAVVLWADLSSTTSRGFTEDQLKDTISYATFKNLRGINLGDNDLSEWDFRSPTSRSIKMVDTVFDSSILAGVHFEGADLHRASFREADFRGNETVTAAANLSETDLTGACFQDAILRGANFTDSVVKYADFSGVTRVVYTLPEYYGSAGLKAQIESTASYAEYQDLRGIVLANNDLDDLDFDGQNMAGASFESTTINDTTFKYGADLTGASFYEAEFSGTVSFRESDLGGATFELATGLASVDFTDAVIAGADFSSTTSGGFDQSQLEDTASWKNGQLMGINFSNNNMTGWNFSSEPGTPPEPDLIRDLSESVFDSTNLTNADFIGTVLVDASFRDATLANTDFAGADLSGATFSQSGSGTLAGADFTGATIIGTDFSSTTAYGLTKEQFYQTSCYLNGVLTKVNLSNNNLSGWNFDSMTLIDVCFDSSSLNNADFSDADLTGVSFCSASLINADLRRANLTDVRFEYTTLTDADFDDAIIVGANFFGATYYGFTQDQFKETASYASRNLVGVGLGYNDLTGWDFDDQDLTDAAFDYSTLIDAYFRRAKLEGAYFYCADISGADFTDADLSGAYFEYAMFNNGTDGEADLTDATIAGAYMPLATAYGFTQDMLESTASWKDDNLTGICLAYCDLSYWDFSGQDLSDADFSSATLTMTDFDDAIVRGANFYQTTERGFTFAQLANTASYDDGDLSGIGLGRNDLTDWDFTGIILDDARFNLSTLDGTIFEYASVQRALFDEAVLSETKFRGADLTGASFVEAEITDVDFFEADLTGADFTDAVFGGVLLSFYDAIIAGANFTAVTDPINFTSEDFRDHFESTASYNNHQLVGIILNENDLTEWNFDLQDLTGARFESAKLNRATFAEATLIGASFVDAELVEAEFFDADLTRASFVGATLVDAYFDDAVIALANFWEATHHGFTVEQLYSTESYHEKNLIGVNLGHNNLTGWSFRRQNLTAASFYMSTLADADFDNAIIAWTNFRATVENGFTEAQLRDTESYYNENLRGIDLSDNDLDGWGFADQNLFHARFEYSSLVGTDLSGANLTDTDFTGATLKRVGQTAADLYGADSRGSVNLPYEDARDYDNFVQPDGHMDGLILQNGDYFRVWDYMGLDTDYDGQPDTPLGIHVSGGFHINENVMDGEVTVTEGGKLIIAMDYDDDWGSTISFEEGIEVKFGGIFKVEFRDGYELGLGSHEWQIFDFTGVTPVGEFQEFVPETLVNRTWDFSQLTTEGILRVVAVAGDINGDGVVDSLDAAILAENWLATDADWSMGDLNNDGVVNDIDATIMASNWGAVFVEPTAVPEPSAIVLLLIAAASVLVIRRARP